MGRPKRIQFAGACYLVQLQGNSRQDLFLSNQDRRLFLSLLKSYKLRHGLKVYAYSLLDHSASLLLETLHPNLSVVMQGLCTRYTKAFNSAHNTVGHVFRGRYKSWLVDKETHLAEMTRWVHLACVREGLRERPWRYQWSSCPAYVEAMHKEPLVDSDAVLRRYGRTRFKQSVRYLKYLEQRAGEPASSGLPIVGGIAIGGEGFLDRLAAHDAAAWPPRRAPVEAALRIIAEVASRRGVDQEKILGRVQWREVSSVRREAIHRVWKETRMGVSELARLFSRTPSAISQLLRVVEEGAPYSIN